MAQHYRDLIAWQKAMDLVEEVYKVTDQFPKREDYSLTDQIRRAAVSIPGNIAEGQAHHSHRGFSHYLRHARGSLAELEAQIQIALRLKYLSDPPTASILKQADEIGRILRGLITSLKAKE